MADNLAWCICCGRTKAICKRDKGCTKKDPTVRAYSKGYYEGGFRMVVQGTPIRVAAHVKGWSPHNKAAICGGTIKRRGGLMRLVLAIWAASLVWAVLTAGVLGEFIGHVDATLLERVAVALR